MKTFIIGSAFAVLLAAGAAVAAPEAVKACCEAMAKCCCDKTDHADCPAANKAH
ncbi:MULTISPECIES: hypothetical protein [Asticcacaulis]|jgi:hypothetical protein|uniref:hypothetical protein n=1 Tax=Asticcacaulis TaxID=76890 RepID=UPI001AE8F82E|nr:MULTISPECIES: hypothetical protein [Asticcacaulis]MBP2160475.1 hypothetical protein [Asticcacaulis solisilvae]MDR6801520.1 hypothetical protein [Asticcacaulis sp. BE141]